MNRIIKMMQRNRTKKISNKIIKSIQMKKIKA